MSLNMARPSWRRPRVLAALLATLVVALVLVGVAAAHTGPSTVSISSTGGYNMCLNNIVNADVYHRFFSVQGTRHPYRAAAYHGDESLAGLSNLTSDDGWYAWDERYMPTGNIKRVRINNMASASGNGQYQCESWAS